MKRVTGAAEVRVFDHTLSRRVPGENDLSTTPGVPRQPANRVHVDQTATSGVIRLRRLYPDEADALLRRRVAIVNLWRPIKSPGSTPRSRLDARSVAPQDLVASDLVFRDRRGETYNLVYNPGQRWFYAPEMRADEGSAQVLRLARRRRGRAFRAAYGFSSIRPRLKTRRRAKASSCARSYFRAGAEGPALTSSVRRR